MLKAIGKNITTFWRDARRFDRREVVRVNAVLVVLLSIPCAIGFNMISGFQPFGEGSCVLDLEDFLVSNTLLPIGSLLFIVFCCHKRGWGEEKFYAEINTGKGFLLDQVEPEEALLREEALIAVILVQETRMKFHVALLLQR